MKNHSEYSKRYGFHIGYANRIIECLFEVASQNIFGRTWSYHKMWYDAKEDRFLTQDTMLGLVKCTVSDEDVLKALAILEGKLKVEEKK